MSLTLCPCIYTNCKLLVYDTPTMSDKNSRLRGTFKAFRLKVGNVSGGRWALSVL